MRTLRHSQIALAAASVAIMSSMPKAADKVNDHLADPSHPDYIKPIVTKEMQALDDRRPIHIAGDETSAGRSGMIDVTAKKAKIGQLNERLLDGNGFKKALRQPEGLTKLKGIIKRGPSMTGHAAFA